MSECVVRMEMPRNCINCDLRYECNAFYAPGKPKPFMKGCRIVCQLPEGHGRLVDINGVSLAMVKRGQRSNRYKLGEKWELNGLEIKEALQTVSTIVPTEAERKVDEPDAVSPTDTPTDIPTITAERRET